MFVTCQAVCLDFVAEDQVGFCILGEVTLKEKAQKRLHLYQMQNGCIYHKIWSEDFPHGVNTARIICMSDKRKVLLQDKSTSTTLELSSDGTKLLNRWHHKGILLTCLYPEQLVYAVKKADVEYEIAIESEKSEIRLQPVAAKPAWPHPYLSVSGNASGIVVTSADHTLDIYNSDGK